MQGPWLEPQGRSFLEYPSLARRVPPKTHRPAGNPDLTIGNKWRGEMLGSTRVSSHTLTRAFARGSAPRGARLVLPRTQRRAHPACSPTTRSPNRTRAVPSGAGPAWLRAAALAVFPLVLDMQDTLVPSPGDRGHMDTQRPAVQSCFSSRDFDILGRGDFSSSLLYTLK